MRSLSGDGTDCQKAYITQNIFQLERKAKSMVTWHLAIALSTTPLAVQQTHHRLFRSYHQEAKAGGDCGNTSPLCFHHHKSSNGTPTGLRFSFFSIRMLFRACCVCIFAFTTYFMLARRHWLRYKALVSCAVCVFCIIGHVYTACYPPFFFKLRLFFLSLEGETRMHREVER